jgi:DNA (cytosine-5)-methyltransferase 1
MGYHLAGFDVIGVDINPQRNYPFEFHQADALEYPLDGFDLIHASPPCQAFSIANSIHGRTDHPNLIPQTRRRLQLSLTDYVIENVPKAPLQTTVMLCGSHFAEVNVKRHRIFECSFHVQQPKCRKGHPGDWLTIFGHQCWERGSVIGKAKGGGNRIKHMDAGIARGRAAMGIDWMSKGELSQAIPPAYTQYIAENFYAFA